MNNQFTRTEMLLGNENMEKLKNSHVAVFGIGGVGSFAAESLARCGVRTLTLIDHDTIDITNINRQIHSTMETIGMQKTDVMERRIKQINPEAAVHAKNVFVLPDNVLTVFDSFDYIIDAVDNVTAKLCIIETAVSRGIPVISAMGTGNKLHPEMLELDDIYNTQMCPLAKVMRKELKKRGIQSLRVCYSKEKPLTSLTDEKRRPGSVSFVPPAAGLIIAGEVVRSLTRPL